MKQWKLYKKDSKGKIRYLQIETEGSLLSQISGIEGSSKPIIHEKISKGKNIGKKNETTPEEQAILEAEALFKDKLTKGYFKTIEEAESEEVILPMLAKSYKDEKHKLVTLFANSDNYQEMVYAQAKLDGMRCLAHINRESSRFGINYSVKLISRDGKQIQNMDHIIKDLLKLSSHLNSSMFPHILDGELYAHGEDFQTNMELIKKYRKGETEKVKFNIYDKINIGEKYEYRRAGLAYIEGISRGLNLDSLSYIHSYEIVSETQLKIAHEGFLQSGYEGTMIRTGKGLYKVNGRSSDLLKYKDFLDIDCKIVSIGPADKRPTWGRPVVEWNGKQFACGTKMSHEAREELLTNADKYIGKIANIRYFEVSNTGIPRFPVMVGIHEDR